MSIIVHVNKFILMRNREQGRDDPAYCVHGPAEDNYPLLGRFSEVHGEGNFSFTPGAKIPIPEPDTEAGATHVMVLDDEECELWGRVNGKGWQRIRNEVAPANVTPFVLRVKDGTLTDGEAKHPTTYVHDGPHIHNIRGREVDHSHEHTHTTDTHNPAKGKHVHGGEEHNQNLSADLTLALARELDE